MNRFANGKVTDLSLFVRGFPILSSGLYYGSDNRLWVGFGGGFGRHENSNWKILKEIEGSASDFTPESEGNLWIATSVGLYKYHDDKEISFYTTSDGLPDNNVVLTYLDRQGKLWAGTFNGIAVLNGDRFVDFKSEPDSPLG